MPLGFQRLVHIFGWYRITLVEGKLDVAWNWWDCTLMTKIHCAIKALSEPCKLTRIT